MSNSAQLLAAASVFGFGATKKEVEVLSRSAWRKEVELLDATIEMLRPQLKYVTNSPGLNNRISSSPYAIIIGRSEDADGLCILDSGRLVSAPARWCKSVSSEWPRTLCTEEAIRKHGLGEIQEGLAKVFSEAMKNLENRKDQLEVRVRKLESSRAMLE